MAIIIEEDRRRSNFAGLIGWFVIAVIIVVAIYYVFIAAPEVVIITPNDAVNQIAPIAQDSIDVGSVVGSPAFKALVPSSIPVVPTSTSGGRPNPFIAP